MIYVLYDAAAGTAHRIGDLTPEDAAGWNRALRQLRWITCEEFYRARRRRTVELRTEHGWRVACEFSNGTEAASTAVALGGRVMEKVVF